MSITRKIGGYTPEIELIGDWVKVRKLLTTLEPIVLEGVMAGQLSASQKLAKIVKRNIRENGGSLGWEPVSPKYKEYKTRLGFDPENLLVMTGLYYRSISIWNNGTSYYVGIKKHTRQTYGGRDKSLASIARILESGTAKGVKARPLWIPSYKQMGGNRRVKGLIIWHIRNKIRIATGLKARITL